MNACIEDLENNENIANGCAIVTYKNDDSKDISTSQDLFSDDDHLRDPAIQSPKLVTKNDTINSSIISIKTPILCSKVTEVTPGRAVVPRTPADLLPFITKTSVLWTSDMETPDGKLNDKTENCDETIDSKVETNNTTPKACQHSPNSADIKEENMNIVSSPLLGRKKRVKRKVKRRILALDIDNNDGQSISSNSDTKVPSESSSVNGEPFFDVKPEMKLNIIEEKNRPNNEEIKENKKLEEATTFDKNSNTSTQDFFSNASFSSIDRLCHNVISEDKPSSIPESEDKENKGIIIKQEIIENDIEPNISNDILERVAAIKRNQKPIRRSIDINHTIIPKEEFSKSLRELELADAKFAQEKKKTSQAQHKPLMSFSELALTENSISVKKEKFVENENHDIPDKIMDDWNVSIFTGVDLDSQGKTLSKVTGPSLKLENGFCSASAEEITKNEKNLQKYMKIFKEIDKEIDSNNDLLALEKSNIKSNSPKQTINQSNIYTMESNNSKANLKLKNQPDIACITFTDGFSTARGKNIAISEDKILDYAKIYNELESENLNENSFLELKNKKTKANNVQLNFEKNTISKTKVVTNIKNEDSKLTISTVKSIEDKKLNTIRLYEELDLKEFLEPKFPSVSEVNINDGFATAGGKGIKINEQKERLYSKIYNELDDVDENSLLSVKKDKVSKPITTIKLKDKAIIKFNNNNNKTDESHSDAKLSRKQSTNDGFSTAGGKGIKISEEKEMMYTKIYNELDETEENGLINFKQKKTSKQVVQKPKTKALIVFNDKQTTTGDRLSMVTNKNIGVQQNSKIASESLSTADEKGMELPTVEVDKANKATTVVNQKEIISATPAEKFFMSNDDDAFYNLGDLESLLVSDDQTLKSNETTGNNHFIVPNTSNIAKKINQASAAAQKLSSTREETQEKSMVAEVTDQKSLKEDKPTCSDVLENNYLNKLKRKLENCETKRSERCRSFGGFPGSSDESVSCTKLNKSDPNNASWNQPLQKGLSVSQHFDLHSDSWLSKLELSDLNASHSKALQIKNESDRIEQKISTAPNDWKVGQGESEIFLGFSYKECTESFKLYANFEKFLKRHIARFKVMRELNIKSGHTHIISILNHTKSDQTLRIHCDCEADLRRGTTESNCILFDSPKKPEFKLPERSQIQAKDDESKEKTADNKIVEKRKHTDTDSDTPLTTLKKPRTGSDLQGRKLFSDDSDADEEEEEEEATKLNVDNLIQLPEVTEEELAELAEMRMDAIMQQEKMIRNKKKIKVKPIIGTLLRERLANSKKRKTWTDYVGSSVPTARPIEQIKQSHPDAKILEVTASNAAGYTFLSSNFVHNKRIVSLQLEDNARLIFDEDGHAGVTEFTDAFLSMPGVDPKLLPTGWIENHYRWIVWKLASIDRINFEKAKLPKMLTPNRVMKELKYRYDREIDRAQRPVLRKILEKDDVPSRRIALCVSSIEDTSVGDDVDKDVKIMLGTRFKIEVTDGWYSIPLTIDNAMSNYVLNGKIKEGTKLITFGAILLECERGFFPLEKPANVSLKIFTNCTRRAKWDTKLGYQENQGPIPVKLRNIVIGGGMVGETTAVAARVYPLLFREKTPNGQSIYRNARSEEKAAAAHERALEKKVDAMYAQAEKKFDNLENSQSGQRNWERKQEKFKQQIETEVREGLPPPRNVSPVLKVRLVDDRSTAILTIWGTNEDSGFEIKEGNTITVYNCYAMGSRAGEMNLTANRLSLIKPEPLLKLPYPMRICTLIPDISPISFDPKFCEFDTVGIVVSHGPAPHGMKNFEIVNMAYPKSNNSGSSYLSILFWNGVSSFGYQAIFSVGAVIACSNLEWRRNTSWSIAIAYCSERTVFTCNPKQQYLNNVVRNLKALIQNPVNYAESCAEEVANELLKKPPPRSNQSTPTNWVNKSHNSSSFISPMDNYTPSHTSVQKRLEKLSRYGSSADISPVVLNNSSSVRIKKDYMPVTPRNT